MASGVYKIENLVNGKLYIGSSGNITRRFLSHKGCLRRNKHPNSHLQYAWNKYGEDKFSFAVLEECEASVQVLEQLEQKHIDELFACTSTLGYNKRVLAFSNLGCKFSAQARANMSAAKIGVKQSAEAIAKRVAKTMGHTWNKGRKMTAEQRDTVKELMALRKRPVIQLALSGDTIMEHSCANDAALTIGCAKSSIARACRTGAITAKFLWRFKDQPLRKYAVTRPGQNYQVEQCSLNGQVLAIWENLKDAAIKTAIGSSGISHCCNGRKKQSNGFVWRYITPAAKEMVNTYT